LPETLFHSPLSHAAAIAVAPNRLKARLCHAERKETEFPEEMRSESRSYQAPKLKPNPLASTHFRKSSPFLSQAVASARYCAHKCFGLFRCDQPGTPILALDSSVREMYICTMPRRLVHNQPKPPQSPPAPTRAPHPTSRRNSPLCRSRTFAMSSRGIRRRFSGQAPQLRRGEQRTHSVETGARSRSRSLVPVKPELPAAISRTLRSPEIQSVWRPRSG